MAEQQQQQLQELVAQLIEAASWPLLVGTGLQLIAGTLHLRNLYMAFSQMLVHRCTALFVINLCIVLSCIPHSTYFCLEPFKQIPFASGSLPGIYPEFF